MALDETTEIAEYKLMDGKIVAVTEDELRVTIPFDISSSDDGSEAIATPQFGRAYVTGGDEGYCDYDADELPEQFKFEVREFTKSNTGKLVNHELGRRVIRP